MQVVVAALVVLAGVAQGAVGWLGWRGRLRRNRFAGVRTAATLASEEAFRAGNRVAAPLLFAAALVALAGGAAALATPSSGAYLTLLAVTAAGVLGLTLAGGTLGDRAARITVATAPMITGCAGCACRLAEGCAGRAASPGGCTRTGVTDS